MNNQHPIRHWLIGGAIALPGALFARFGALLFTDGARPLVKAGGMLAALGGLFIISIGVRRNAVSEPEYRHSTHGRTTAPNKITTTTTSHS
jgi:hypothetical protein